VYEHIQTAERGDHVADSTTRGLLVAEVRGKSDAAYSISGRLGGIGVEVADSDGGSKLGQRLGGRRADVAGTADDERPAARESGKLRDCAQTRSSGTSS